MKNLIIWPFLIGIVLFVNKCHSFEDDFNFVNLDSVENKLNNYYKLDLVRSKRDSSNEDKKLSKNKDKLLLSKFNVNDTSSLLDKTQELSEEIEKNKNNTIDDHSYYKVGFFPNDKTKTNDYWVDMSNNSDKKRHDMLSSAHRRAATVKLSFKFPFYGFKIDNVTIATGGFLFLGDAVHTWLAATQYIAPLMANFDSSLDKKSSIYYLDNNSSFVVQWDNVYLQEVTSNSSSSSNSTTGEKDKSSEKPFSFQVTLKDNGDIIFVYKNVPLEVLKINEDKHPVKVGISDAYIIDRTVFFIRRKTIYEYHKAELKNKNITDNTVIYFEALPTCNTLKDCTTCTTKKINFECQWCEANQRCSDGFDRHRQDWLKSKCVDNSKSVCSIPKITEQPLINVDDNSNIAHSNNQAVVKPNNDIVNKVEKEKIIVNDKVQAKNIASKEQNKSRRSNFATGFILLTLIAIVAYWGMYAYRNPQSRPGQFLIKYRPAQWSLHNSETRYATEFDSIS